MAYRQTPSQTVGPYFACGLTPERYGHDLAGVARPSMIGEDTRGEPIRVVGQVFDGAGVPVTDAVVEVWQADAEGRYAHPADERASNATFKGFGRCGTGSGGEGGFAFTTIRPGAIGDGQAPHLNVIVLMRGLLSHCFTRVYFGDRAEANATDPVLNGVPAERRGTLIATREATPSGVVYRFDIRMQGDRETVFFDV